MGKIYDTPRSFGTGSILLHWAVAGIAIALLVTGYWFLALPRGPEKGAMLAVHVDLGWWLAFLVALRLLWRLFNPLPALASGRPWEYALARLVQWLMVALLVAFAITGYMSIATNPRIQSVSVLGWFELPRLDDPGRTLHRASEEVHLWLSHGFAAILLLHVAGALKRSLVNRDGTLRRMVWPRGDVPGVAR